MAKSEILMVLSSAFQPTKFGNATDVVGALRQDRYSGIMGELGAEAPSIPVHVKLRSHGTGNTVFKEKDLHFNVFVHQKWTPFLMMLTLFNSLQQMNEYADEMTYQMSGNVVVDGHRIFIFRPCSRPAKCRCLRRWCWRDGGAINSTGCF